jgi:hypothetical protein
MYQQHPVFDPPPPQAKLWRYIDFTKYVWLLDAHALFFSRADLLGDPFEGSLSRLNVELRPQIYAGRILDDQLELLAEFRRKLLRTTFVNCWHMSDYESAAMWKLYLRDHGVAIQTTFEALVASLTSDSACSARVVD